MDTIDLLAELREARRGLTAEHRADLLSAGVPADIINLYPLVGHAPVRVSRGLYQPAHDGLPAFISPVLVGDVLSPECAHPLEHARHLGHCVDLVAWHPAHPGSYALRTGAATWLGCIEPQFCEPPPVAVRRSVLAWLRAGCDGLVLLSSAPADVYSVLTCCLSLEAEDGAHAAELRRTMRAPWGAPRVRVAANEGAHACGIEHAT